MSQRQFGKMKSSKVHRHYFFSFSCQMSGVTRALLGICVFLFEIHQSQETSGLSWNSNNSRENTLASTSSVALANTILAKNVVLSPEAPEPNGIPQFHSPRVRITVKEGDTVQLPCKIHNLGDDHVIWRHGTNVLAGTNVSTYSDPRIKLLEDLTLQISGVIRGDDEGDYECILTGAFPRPGLIHSVIVHDAPTVRLITPTQLSVMEGENVEIGCIPQGNPLPRITWSMRDVLSPIPIPKSMLHLHRITLEKVTGRHAGLYVCEADNGVGRPAVGAVYVRVLYAPEIEIPKTRVHGGVGFKAELVCMVHADPPAEVSWKIDGEVIESSNRVCTEKRGLNEHVLVLNSVKDYDFKTYTCVANNSRGHDLRIIEFTGVPNPPVINSWETQILVKATINETEGTQIQEEITVTLFWKVECKSSLIDYHLHFRPDIRNEISSFPENGTPSWTVLTIPADQSTASFLHTKTFPLRGLQPSTIYEVAVKARNKHGWSPLSDICYFSTFPNSSSTKQREFLGSIQKWKDSMLPGRGTGSGREPKEENAGFKSSESSSKTRDSRCILCGGLLLLSLLPVICKLCGLD